MRLSRKRGILSIILSVCLVFGALPVDMLGGVLKVEAAEVLTDDVVYNVSEWTTSSGDAGYECRTVSWEFTQAASGGNIGIGDTLQGIKSNEGTIQLKKIKADTGIGEGLSIAKGSVLIPLDVATTSVGVSFTLTSNNSKRYLAVGGDNASQKIYHGKNDSKEEVDGILDGSKSFSASYDSNYFTDSFLKLASYTTDDTDSGESKIGTITLIENRLATGEVGPVVTEVKANVQVNDSENLLGTENKITLKNKADDTNTYDITTSGDYILKANAEYDILVNNSDIKATVGDAATVKTGTADITVAVDVASSVVNPTVKIVDKDSLLGDGVLTLTSGDETHTLTNDTAVKLKIGSTYKLTCTNSALVATIGGTTLLAAIAGLETIQVDIKAVDTSKHIYDVWDFGAEQLESTGSITYNNKLTVDIINSWYPSGLIVGSSNTNNLLGNFEVSDKDGNPELIFNTSGKTNNRIRTTNTKITRYNENSLKDIEDSDIVYTGYLYSNTYNQKEPDMVNLQLAVKAGDIVTFVVSRNNASSDITWRAPSGEKKVQTYSGTSSQAQAMTFYAAEDGMYTLYSATDKLVVAQILRERPTNVTVSGSVTVPVGANLADAKLVFTNDTTGTETKAAITNGAYTVTLQEQYSYSVSLEGANGYIVGANNNVTIANEAGNTTFPIEVISVELLDISGSLADLTKEEAANLELTFTSENVFVPEFSVNAENSTYTVKLEKGVEYQLTEVGVNDYTLETTTMKMDASGKFDIKFTKKPVYAINVTLEGVTAQEAGVAELTFTNINEEGYVYTFIGTSGIQLRDGQYKVEVSLNGYTQQLTTDVKVARAAVDKTIVMKSNNEVPKTPYKKEVSVGASKEYKTINEALEAVRNMERADDQRVTISIEPGNYEEMLVIDVDNVTLKNAAATPSIDLKNKGVDIADGAVRITSYYGHGYTYYSMGDDCKYNEELLQVNKENGYPSFENPGSGTTSGSYWNTTVMVGANGFQADGIIFENSFNQYVSDKAANDIIVKRAGAKEGSVARADMKAGDVTVQNKSYVERASALAIGNNKVDIVFDNCKFVGRQDTLYGGTGVYVEFNDCSVYGGTDYIFGGMTAIFNKCDLVFNTNEDDKNDVGYITAAQQSSGRGYLMYECRVTSTTPEVDTASKKTSRPGYFGRPWTKDTSEVVFYNTTIDAADGYWENENTSISKTYGKSLIVSEGWDSGLGGESVGMYEYGTTEEAKDYTAHRVSWATALTEPILNDGTKISLDAFRRTIVDPIDPTEVYYDIDLTQGLKAGTTYDGGISVLQDMAYKVDNKNIAGTDYIGCVTGVDNPLTGSSSAKGTIPDSGSVLKLTAEKDGKLRVAAKVGKGKTVYMVDESTESAESYENSSSVDELTLLTYNVYAGSTYYFYGNGTKVSMYGIMVDYREPASWDSIAAPVLDTPTVDGKEGTITVPFTGQIGGIYADSIEVRMLSKGEIVDTMSFAADAENGEVTFTPNASGTYTFQGVLRRSGALGKMSNESNSVDFILPMREPIIINVENTGSGSVKFSWKEVPEAETYNVYLDGVFQETVTKPFSRFTGLAIGQEYEFGVEAVRGEDISPLAVEKQTITEDAKKTWSYAAFGSGVDTKNNAFKGTIEGNDLSLWSKGGKGKLVPASTDGLAFYYTTIDPETENFTLSADITVDSWTYSNGQEGFGLMAADNVGINGDSSTFWNNSYMATVTKVEYLWDNSTGKVSDAGDKYTMKLGIGSQEKIGVTKENIAEDNVIKDFITRMSTLETSGPSQKLPAGTYNRVGKYTNENVDLGDLNTQTTFHMTIQRNNTGYFLSYTDENGKTTTNKYYHGDEGDELTKIDENNIYIGFFASRYATIKINNVDLKTISPEADAPAEVRPITMVTPNYSIESAKIANSADYEMVYYGNADGVLTIKGPNGVVVEQQKVQAKNKFRVNTTLNKGNNEFIVTFNPDDDFVPSKYERLSSYDTKEFKVTVTYEKHKGDIIYVSPDGKAKAKGTKNSPMDIYTAVKYAVPGQKILLKEGNYNLSTTVTIERGINGSDKEKIYLMADPEAKSRPVFDFGRKCAGLVLAADNWYLQGFDVTNSSDGQKGVQVSGSYNILDDMMTYKNGNTGIQISRYKSTDLWEDWPSNNLILNCTSYLNADPGYEDADGFAAKLTIADGNVFDGCIAAYNADDGWDLFAKIESGPIGKVEILNSLAFKNGYVMDAEGNEINAGNGNGFKMGGSSMSGYHVLKNSVAFANKAKGIDSNSCPDVIVYNSTSFDNESFNVAFYTNDVKNTDFEAKGILSYKKSNAVAEQLKLKGKQDESKVYDSSNYFFNGKKSKNSKGTEVTDAWFVSLDTKAAINGGITRNQDGTINMNGYLELTDAAPADAGARMSGNASGNISAQEREILTALDNCLSDLENAATSGKEKEAVEKVQDQLEIIRGLEDITITSTEILDRLSKIELKIKELLNTSVTVKNNSNKVKYIEVLNTLISITAGKNGELKVENVTLSKEETSEFITDNIKKYVALDLSLYEDSKKVSLRVPVKVNVTVPSIMSAKKDIVVLHKNKDGVVETLNYTIENDDQISFVTPSFGTFVIGSGDAGNSNEGNNNNNNDNDNNSNNGKEEQEREIIISLNNNLAVLNNASAENAKEAVETVQKEVEHIKGIKEITISSTEALDSLSKIEAKIKNLLNTDVTVKNSKSKVKNVEIMNALLSVSAGKNGELRVEDVKLSKNERKAYLTSDIGKYVAFDLSLYEDSAKISLKVPVKIKLTIPSTIDAKKNLVVLHIKDNGEIEGLNYTIEEGNQISFVTSSFSTFIIANGNSSNSTNVSDKRSPSTNDNSLFVAENNQINNDQADNKQVDNNQSDNNNKSIDSTNAAVMAVANNVYGSWFAALAVLVIAGLGIVSFIAYKNRQKNDDLEA